MRMLRHGSRVLSVDLVTANAFERVLEIRTALGAGTAFTLERNGREHVVTARHLLPNGESRPQATLSSRHITRTLRLDLLPAEPENADVAVAPLPEPMTPTLPLAAGKDGIIWGQRIHFLGFPFGLATEFARGEPDQRIAFVKGGVFSASADVDGVSLLYLDGMNNPGFSGGPVIFNRDGDHLRPQVRCDRWLSDGATAGLPRDRANHRCGDASKHRHHHRNRHPPRDRSHRLHVALTSRARGTDRFWRGQANATRG